MAAEAMPVAAGLKAEGEREGGLTYTWRPAATSAVAAAKAEAPQRALKRLRGGGDQVIRGKPGAASQRCRGTETSAEDLVGPPKNLVVAVAKTHYY